MPITNIRGQQILNGTVQYVDIQQVSASKLVGNPTGSAATISEISLGTGLGFSGTSVVLSANLQSLSALSYSSASFVKMTAAGTFALDTNTYYLASNPNGYTSNTGTVTSVGLSLPAIFSVSGSPVTTSGTLTASLASQTANTVFAAPNGSAGSPAFRALVAADIPALSYQAPLNGTGYVKMSGTTVSYVASIPNGDLANSSITVQGTSVSLGGSVNVINGTGFVKASGATISYDNSTYSLSSHTHYIGTTAVQASSANQALTGITGITFVAEGSDSASIVSTISGTSTFFDFNLTDDNNNDEWRWRFTPSGGTVYNAMRLVPKTNTASDLIVSGTITGSQIIRSGGTSSQFLKADGSVDTNAYITGNQTITVSGDASGSGTTAITLTLATVNSNIGTFNNVTVNAKGLVTAASNVAYSTSGHTHDDRYLPFSANTETSSLAVGWYTVAINSGSRAVGKFIIRDTSSGNHQSCVFYATHHYGNYSDITVLQNSRYSGDPFRYIRIKEGGTYDGALLQVYLDQADSTIKAWLLENIQSSGWSLVNWVADATDPGGLGNFAALTNVAAQVDLNQIQQGGITTTGPVYGGGDTTQYEYLNTNNYSTTTDTRYYTQTTIQNIFGGSSAMSGYNKSNWDTAYGWGNHASAGYITGAYTYYIGTTQNALNRSSAAQTLTGVSIDGNAGSANYAYKIYFDDGPRDLSNRLPNSFTRNVLWDFVTAGTVGGTGNYAGVMTFMPWTGTTASTGDSSYQLAFMNESSVNGAGLPGLRLRKGIDSTWGTWYTLLHAGNYNSYSPTLTGGGATGSWGISITGNAATVGNLFVHGNRNDEANKIVRTDGAGYIQAGWINTTSGDNGTTAIDRVYASSDGYIRYYTPANFRTVLDVPTRTGGSASGTWSINITGSAGSVAWANVTSKPNEIFNYDGWVSNPGYDANTIAGNKSGFTYANNAPYNGPMVHFASSGYGLQMNATYSGNGLLLAYRTRNGDAGTWNSWHRILATGQDPYPSDMNQYVRTSDTVRFNQARFTSRISIGDGNGTPYLNTGSPGVWLSYNGGSDLFMGAESASSWGVYIGAWRMTVNNSGTLTVGGDVIAYGTPSDARLKTIKEVIQNPIDKIKALTGYRFDWNKTDSILNLKEDIGVIAQEVADVLPELARTNDNGYMSVRYQGLTAVLIEAVKEQQKQIEDLKKQIEFLAENR
jgi:hypothetical protein